MKITAFLGSPRRGGNTDTLALRVLEGAKEAGYDAEAFALRDMSIRPCTGCDKCWHGGRPCVFRDDMDSLYEAIASSDVLLFATPVYWYSPTAIMKAFMDRLIPLNREQGQGFVKGKRAVLVTAYEEEGPEAVKPLIRMFDLSFDYLGLSVAGRVVVDGVGPKGAVQKKPDSLQRAFQVGRRLTGE